MTGIFMTATTNPLPPSQATGAYFFAKTTAKPQETESKRDIKRKQSHINKIIDNKISKIFDIRVYPLYNVANFRGKGG